MIDFLVRIFKSINIIEKRDYYRIRKRDIVIFVYKISMDIDIMVNRNNSIMVIFINFSYLLREDRLRKIKLLKKNKSLVL